MNKIPIVFLFFMTSFKVFGGFTISGLTVSQSGASAGARDTPQGIINIGGGTLIGYKTIKVTHHVYINGFYEDTGWTYIFDTGIIIRGNSALTDWKSGEIIFGDKVNGARFVTDGGYNLANQRFLGNGAKIEWYDVRISGNNQASEARFEIEDLHDDSILNLTFTGIEYPSFGWGNIAEANIWVEDTVFIRFGGNSPPTITSLSHSASALHNILLNLAASFPIELSDYVPLGDGTAYAFFHNKGSDRRYILKNPTINKDVISIYNNGEVVQIDQEVAVFLESDNGSLTNGVNIYFYTQDQTYMFSNTISTNANGQASTTLEETWKGSGNTAVAYTIPTTVVDRTDIELVLVKYENEIQIGSFSGNTGKKTLSFIARSDTDITESNKTVVNAYTTIADLSQLYDRAKSWKTEAANLTYPLIDSQLITANNTTLNLGDQDLFIDGTATSPFVVNKTASTTTIAVSPTLRAGTKFDRLVTTGTLTTTNGAALEVGYTDSSGSYVYVELTGMDQQDLAITAMNAGVSSTLLRLSNLSGTYKGHVQLPSLTASITALATRDGFAPWTDMLPIGDMLFQREVSTSPSSVTGSNQQLMIQLTYKLLQKTEALSNALYNTNNPVPSITVNTTTTSPTHIPSVANQESMLQLLYRILGKTTSLREAIQEE